MTAPTTTVQQQVGFAECSSVIRYDVAEVNSGQDVGGDPVIGAEVDAYATTPQIVSSIQMGTRVAAATTNAVGYFEFYLERSSEVRFSIEDAGVDETRTVPDTASQALATWT